MDSEKAVPAVKSDSFMSRFGRRNVIIVSSIVVVLVVIATLTSQVV